MKTLKFTDPNGNHTGFKDVDVKVDLISTNEDNLTVYEVESENIYLANTIGLNIPCPWVSTLAFFKSKANELGLALKVIENSQILQDDSIVLQNYSTVQNGGVNNTTTTTGIRFTFTQPALGLTASNITLVGATKGTLTVVGGTNNKEWILTISSITVFNGGIVTSSISNWTNSGKTYRVKTSQPVNTTVYKQA